MTYRYATEEKPFVAILVFSIYFTFCMPSAMQISLALISFVWTSEDYPIYNRRGGGQCVKTLY